MDFGLKQSWWTFWGSKCPNCWEFSEKFFREWKTAVISTKFPKIPVTS